MNRSILITMAMLFTFGNQIASAGTISDTYTAGDTLTAAKMDNIKTAVNDNDTRIGNLSLSAQASINSQVAVGPSGDVEIINVGFTCPADGFVIAQGTITVDLNHTTGTTDNMYLKISKTVETAFFNSGWTQTIIQSALPTMSAARSPVHLIARFPCTGGVSETYRINANMIQGGDALDRAGWGNIIVQYSQN